MALTPEKRAGLQTRLRRLTAARKAADEAYLLAIYEAGEDGASYDDIAHMVGDKSGSGIAAKRRKGKAIKEARQRR